MKRIVFEGVLDGIVIDRVVRDSAFSMPAMHFHHEFEIYYLFEGARYYFVENKTYPIRKGSLVLVDAMQIHKTSDHGNPAHDRLLIELTPEPFSAFLKNVCGITLGSLFREYAGVWELNENEQRYVERLLRIIMAEFKGHQPHFESLVMIKIAELLVFVTRLQGGSRAGSGAAMSHTAKHRQIHNITEYISQNYHSVKTLTEICGKFFISKSYLCRILKR